MKKDGFAKLKSEKIKNPEQEANRMYNMFHYFQVEWLAAERWQNRSAAIQTHMDEDEAKDRRLSEARLSSEPTCQHCGETGLRIISKDLVSRDDNYENEEVLFILQCVTCNKRTAVWPDGALWARRAILCPKCTTGMTETSKRVKNVITDTYTCPNCRYTYKEKLDLSPSKKQEKPDPYWERDSARFLLTDEEGKKHIEAKRNLEQLSHLVNDMKEREANKNIYNAIASIQKVKIGQLNGILAPVIEKAGYTEPTFDKPEIGIDVFISFSCLDSDAERAEYDSRKVLEKTIKHALEGTNWRLMTSGVTYRLGYLSGKLRAYEREDDLKKIITKGMLAKAKKQRSDKTSEKNPYVIKEKDGEDIVL